MQGIGKIVLGTVQLGLDYGINNKDGKPDNLTINEILATAFSRGVTALDTAEAYGNAHDVIGNFHIANPDKIFKVITKLPHIIDSNIETKIDAYLRALHVPQLEALLFHSFDTYKQHGAAIKQLDAYKADGKVKYFGVSIYTNDQFREVIEDDLIEIIQLPFNLFDNITYKGELLKEAKRRGKIVHTRSAFLQGLFFTSANTNSSPVVKLLESELSYIRDMSKKYHISLQRLALGYCLGQQEVDSVMIGVDNLSQLEQNLADAAYQLPHEVIELVNSIDIKNKDLLNPSLWNLLKR